uniref:Copper transport protein n=1 Tax=Acrobeloides nanus TaxID=290746 RepID=A0A914C9M3_9BILA
MNNMDSEGSTNMDSITDYGVNSLSMSFHFGYNQIILFNFWSIDSPGVMVLSCIIIIILCFILEMVRYLREPITNGLNRNKVNAGLLTISEASKLLVSNATLQIPQLILAYICGTGRSFRVFYV